MESTLVIVASFSLLLAVAMSYVAWRLIREERRRSMERSDTLASLAAGDDAPEVADDVPAALLSSPASDGVDPPESWDDALRSPGGSDASMEPDAAGVVATGAMFSQSAATGGGSSGRWLALAAVALVMLAGAGSMYALHVQPHFTALAAEQDLAGPTPSGPPPLELLSLRNSSDASGTFTVTGLVQNPAGGWSRAGIVAVVYLFDREGHYFASGRSTLDLDVLQPGGESPFVVRIRGAFGVSRYRIGFRSEDGSVVAHVDRRAGEPATASDETPHTPSSTSSVRGADHD